MNKTCLLISVNCTFFLLPQLALAAPLAVPVHSGVLSGMFSFGALLTTVGLVFLAARFNKAGDSQADTGGKAGNAVSDESAGLNTALQYMQCALDQAAQAESAAGRACSGPRGQRLAAASEAQNHADYARNWAEQATERTYTAGSPAQDAAAKARNAAYRAQAAADRARYNADTAPA